VDAARRALCRRDERPDSGRFAALAPVRGDAAAIGYLLFGEVTDAWTWIGAAIIVGASMYVAYREAHLARHGRRPAAPGVVAR
jgi:hypothetical protein